MNTQTTYKDKLFYKIGLHFSENDFFGGNEFSFVAPNCTEVIVKCNFMVKETPHITFEGDVSNTGFKSFFPTLADLGFINSFNYFEQYLAYLIDELYFKYGGKERAENRLKQKQLKLF